MQPFQFKLVGYSHYNFTSDAGKHVEGFKFHVNRPCTRSGFNGLEACSINVTPEMVQACGEPVVNGTYNVIYDQSGRVGGYTLVKSVQPAVK